MTEFNLQLAKGQYDASKGGKRPKRRRTRSTGLTWSSEDVSLPDIPENMAISEPKLFDTDQDFRLSYDVKNCDWKVPNVSNTKSMTRHVVPHKNEDGWRLEKNQRPSHLHQTFAYPKGQFAHGNSSTFPHILQTPSSKRLVLGSMDKKLRYVSNQGEMPRRNLANSEQSQDYRDASTILSRDTNTENEMHILYHGPFVSTTMIVSPDDRRTFRDPVITGATQEKNHWRNERERLLNDLGDILIRMDTPEPEDAILSPIEDQFTVGGHNLDEFPEDYHSQDYSKPTYDVGIQCSFVGDDGTSNRDKSVVHDQRQFSNESALPQPTTAESTTLTVPPSSTALELRNDNWDMCLNVKTMTDPLEDQPIFSEPATHHDHCEGKSLSSPLDHGQSETTDFPDRLPEPAFESISTSSNATIQPEWHTYGTEKKHLRIRPADAVNGLQIQSDVDKSPMDISTDEDSNALLGKSSSESDQFLESTDCLTSILFTSSDDSNDGNSAEQLAMSELCVSPWREVIHMGTKRGRRTDAQNDVEIMKIQSSECSKDQLTDETKLSEKAERIPKQYLSTDDPKRDDRYHLQETIEGISKNQDNSLSDSALMTSRDSSIGSEIIHSTDDVLNTDSCNANITIECQKSETPASTPKITNRTLNRRPSRIPVPKSKLLKYKLDTTILQSSGEKEHFPSPDSDLRSHDLTECRTLSLKVPVTVGTLAYRDPLAPHMQNDRGINMSELTQNSERNTYRREMERGNVHTDQLPPNSPQDRDSVISEIAEYSDGNSFRDEMAVDIAQSDLLTVNIHKVPGNNIHELTEISDRNLCTDHMAVDIAQCDIITPNIQEDSDSHISDITEHSDRHSCRAEMVVDVAQSDLLTPNIHKDPGSHISKITKHSDRDPCRAEMAVDVTQSDLLTPNIQEDSDSHISDITEHSDRDPCRAEMAVDVAQSDLLTPNIQEDPGSHISKITKHSDRDPCRAEMAVDVAQSDLLTPNIQKDSGSHISEITEISDRNLCTDQIAVEVAQCDNITPNIQKDPRSHISEITEHSDRDPCRAEMAVDVAHSGLLTPNIQEYRVSHTSEITRNSDDNPLRREMVNGKARTDPLFRLNNQEENSDRNLGRNETVHIITNYDSRIKEVHGAHIHEETESSERKKCKDEDFHEYSSINGPNYNDDHLTTLTDPVISVTIKQSSIHSPSNNEIGSKVPSNNSPVNVCLERSIDGSPNISPVKREPSDNQYSNGTLKTLGENTDANVSSIRHYPLEKRSDDERVALETHSPSPSQPHLNLKGWKGEECESSKLSTRYNIQESNPNSTKSASKHLNEDAEFLALEAQCQNDDFSENSNSFKIDDEDSINTLQIIEDLIKLYPDDRSSASRRSFKSKLPLPTTKLYRSKSSLADLYREHRCPIQYDKIPYQKQRSVARISPMCRSGTGQEGVLTAPILNKQFKSRIPIPSPPQPKIIELVQQKIKPKRTHSTREVRPRGHLWAYSSSPDLATTEFERYQSLKRPRRTSGTTTPIGTPRGGSLKRGVGRAKAPQSFKSRECAIVPLPEWNRLKEMQSSAHLPRQSRTCPPSPGEPFSLSRWSSEEFQRHTPPSRKSPITPKKSRWRADGKVPEHLKWKYTPVKDNNDEIDIDGTERDMLKPIPPKTDLYSPRRFLADDHVSSSNISEAENNKGYGVKTHTSLKLPTASDPETGISKYESSLPGDLHRGMSFGEMSMVTTYTTGTDMTEDSMLRSNFSLPVDAKRRSWRRRLSLRRKKSVDRSNADFDEQEPNKKPEKKTRKMRFLKWLGLRR